MEHKYFIGSNGELYHWGVKGMKWGVRRYQNKDGTLTNAGKKRYADNESDESVSVGNKGTGGEKNKTSKFNKAFEPSIKGGKDKPNISPAEKITKESYKITEESAALLNSMNRLQNAKTGSPTKTMTNQELQEAINRLTLEQRYDSLTSAQTSRGMTYVNETLSTIGSAVTIAGAIAGIVSTVHTIKKG